MRARPCVHTGGAATGKEDGEREGEGKDKSMR